MGMEMVCLIGSALVVWHIGSVLFLFSKYDKIGGFIVFFSSFYAICSMLACAAWLASNSSLLASCCFLSIFSNVEYP